MKFVRRATRLFYMTTYNIPFHFVEPHLSSNKCLITAHQRGISWEKSNFLLKHCIWKLLRMEWESLLPVFTICLATFFVLCPQELASSTRGGQIAYRLAQLSIWCRMYELELAQKGAVLLELLVRKECFAIGVSKVSIQESATETIQMCFHSEGRVVLPGIACSAIMHASENHPSSKCSPSHAQEPNNMHSQCVLHGSGKGLCTLRNSLNPFIESGRGDRGWTWGCQYCHKMHVFSGSCFRGFLLSILLQACKTSGEWGRWGLLVKCGPWILHYIEWRLILSQEGGVHSDPKKMKPPTDASRVCRFLGNQSVERIHPSRTPNGVGSHKWFKKTKMLLMNSLCSIHLVHSQPMHHLTA
jgi:hypothetical protein